MNIEIRMLFLLVAASFGVIFIHEVGHLFVARLLGIKVALLTVGVGPGIVSLTDRFGTRWQLALLPIGGSCGIVEDASRKPRASSGRRGPVAEASLLHRAMVYLAGPLANVAFACLLLLPLLCRRLGTVSFALPDDVETEFELLFGGLSLCMGLFNLLPMLPLDGGRLAILAFEAWFGLRPSAREERLFSTIGQSLLAAGTLVSMFVFGWRMSNAFDASTFSWAPQ